MPDNSAKTKKEKKVEKLQKEIRKKVAGYMVAGFALVAGLAWNDAIKSLIEAVFPKGGANTILAKFIYAFIVTIVIVIVSMYITKLLVKEEKEEKEGK